MYAVTLSTILSFCSNKTLFKKTAIHAVKTKISNKKILLSVLAKGSEFPLASVKMTPISDCL